MTIAVGVIISCLWELQILFIAHRKSFPPLYGLNVIIKSKISWGISLALPFLGSLALAIVLARSSPKGKCALLPVLPAAIAAEYPAWSRAIRKLLRASKATRAKILGTGLVSLSFWISSVPSP